MKTYVVGTGYLALLMSTHYRCFCGEIQKNKTSNEYPQQIISWRNKKSIYRIYCMYSDRQAWANSIEPDETPQSTAPHQDLHCLPLTSSKFWTQHRVVSCTCSNFRTSMVRSWGVQILRVRSIFLLKKSLIWSDGLCLHCLFRHVRIFSVAHMCCMNLKWFFFK